MAEQTKSRSLLSPFCLASKSNEEKPIDNYYPHRISWNDPNLSTKLLEAYKAEGLAVITDIFSPIECSTWTDEMVTYIEQLGTGVDRKNIPKTWIPPNLPPQTRPGLFQALLSNMPPVWTIRSHPRVYQLFCILYSALRGKEVKDFIVSGDALNIRPVGLDEFKPPGEDWAHLDQTTRDNPWQCIQGQAVLANTTACVRASPRSIHVFTSLLDLAEKSPDDKTNWCKFPQSLYPKARSLVESVGGQWQIPIRTPKGSFIVWSSATVHSAMTASSPVAPNLEDPWNGWRCVVYVCMHPRNEVSDRDLEKRRRAYRENRTTNHWISTIFPKRRDRGEIQYHPTMEAMIQDPTLLYKTTKGCPTLTPQQQRLLGLPTYSLHSFFKPSPSKEE